MSGLDLQSVQAARGKQKRLGSEVYVLSFKTHFKYGIFARIAFVTGWVLSVRVAEISLRSRSITVG